MLNVTQALDFIRQNKKVAIVGLSPKEDRPSYRVAKFLIDKGFDIIPINPGYQAILGKPCLKQLTDLAPGAVDWVDLFVNPKRLMDLATGITTLSPKLVWCQIGVVNHQFNQSLEKAGIPYIADVCPKMEWEQLE
jgi:hypothetical protein